jgi:hypothetical protein
VDAPLGPQPAVRTAAVDLDRDALEPGLLAFLLVDDLGVEAVALRPAEVHPEEHLRPVRCLRAAGPGADREDRAALVVLTGEEQGRPLPGEIGLEGRRPAVELRGQLGVAGLLDELEGREEVVGAALEAAPKLDLGTEIACLAKDLLRAALVVPEPGFGCQRLELRGARLFRPEVKDAPRSTGSARSGRGWRTRPP